MGLNLLCFTWTNPRNLLLPESVREKIQRYKPTIVVFSVYDSPMNSFHDNILGGYIHLHTCAYRNNRMIIYSQNPFPILTTAQAEPVTKRRDQGLLTILNLSPGHRLGLISVDIHNKASYDNICQTILYTPAMDYVAMMGRFTLTSSDCDISMAITHPNVCSKDNLVPYLMEEGVQNNGPRFPPTCYLQQGRVLSPHPENLLLTPIQSNDYLPASNPVFPNDFQNTFNWCDRIFYGKFQRANSVGYVCEDYDRIDDFHSNHAIVYALFNFIV